MATSQPACLLDYLSAVPDPRSARGKRHQLRAMLAAVCCAILCGARGFKPIAQWVHDQEIGLVHALGFTRTPPRWGAFRKLLVALDPTAFEAALSRWAEDCSAALPEERRGAGGLEPVALDGKAARGSLSPHHKAIHLLSIMAQRSGLTLVQAEVGAKTNEHKAALVLLRELVLRGRVVTADAIFCQRDLCQDIITQGGHYFVAVKENQPALLRDLQDAFTPPPEAAFSPSTAGPYR
jgi:DDE_Tnp_1-associated/Transposase DDE domain